jgi:hypothetical protein
MRVFPQTLAGSTIFDEDHSSADNTDTDKIVKIGSKVKARIEQTISIVVRKFFSLSSRILIILMLASFKPCLLYNPFLCFLSEMYEAKYTIWVRKNVVHAKESLQSIQ